MLRQRRCIRRKLQRRACSQGGASVSDTKCGTVGCLAFLNRLRGIETESLPSSKCACLIRTPETKLAAEVTRHPLAALWQPPPPSCWFRSEYGQTVDLGLGLISAATIPKMTDNSDCPPEWQRWSNQTPQPNLQQRAAGCLPLLPRGSLQAAAAPALVRSRPDRGPRLPGQAAAAAAGGTAV